MLSVGTTIAHAIVGNALVHGGDWPSDATHKVTCYHRVDGIVKVCAYFARSAGGARSVVRAHMDSDFLHGLFPTAKEVSHQLETIFVEEWDWGPQIVPTKDYM